MQRTAYHYQRGLMRALRVGLSAALLVVSPNLISQEESDNHSLELEPIAVTGTRIKRTDVEGSTPVTIIDREMIEASGQATIAQLLHSSTYNSFGSFRESSGWSNGFSGAAFVNLRGLGPELPGGEAQRYSVAGGISRISKRGY